ncbi:kinase-like domain-containing protein [Cokeromyces recurvatus]|uniref:kinase-like domain-containing protein n=1 Tax=Cokeromyces recurvatus TaxID=90255 RepID=UPI00221FD2E8|nr:kinase-like domain-containing protein [Cokeromyces recurvatus]KAI7899788.1 kinase-like domain-containing protein [Cokeromyces recurvatus]
MEEIQTRIKEVQSKIEQNTQLKNKAIELRKFLQDRNAQRQCDTQIRESQRYIDYFTEELKRLKIKSNRASYISIKSHDNSQQDNQSVVKSPIPISFEEKEEEEAVTKRFSNLDLLEADTPINRAKVSLKLHELEYKVDVEKKVQEGIRNLSKTLSSTTDRRRKQELSEKQLESIEKMALLAYAVKKYKDLYLGEEEDGHVDNDSTNNINEEKGMPVARRRPVTGQLQLKIVKAHELVHAPTRMFQNPQTAVMIKIDGAIQNRTRPSRNDVWGDQFDLIVDKATEVELLIYDQSGDRTLPIGLLWLKISDIAETLRKQKLENQPVGIHAWFDVEPLGKILLDLNFIRDVKKRPMDKLGRVGAVRERKGEIHEMNGHQFVARRFYHIMKCALCGDFMTKLAYQCEDCGLACHRKCYTKVVTRCISRSKLKHDEDELKHRIPHRFEPLTIIGANWCCHCGFMLPLGFRGAQKCAECSVVCHTKCAKLVPDFCGMSMEKANLMLSEMKAANRRRTIHADSLSQTDLQKVLPRPLSVHDTISSSQTLINLFNQPFEPKHTAITTPVQVNRKVGLDDFNFLAVLGRGNFGKVMLAEEKYTNELYAIKILKKRFVLDNDEVESTRAEKRVFLAANRHPFLVNLHSTFQTETRIYYVMEYVSGGDLMMHIQRELFSEQRARFYACEVLLALEYFHRQGIIYRDLKLDNIMLGLDGHIKLADYGLCKDGMVGDKKTNTFCGTPEFMAPEILLEHKYGRAVDWWAFGVLLYEMLLGQSPFKGEDEDEIFDAVLEDKIMYPNEMTKESISICEALLERNPEKRLGGGKGDAQEIKGHLFFAGVNWEDMLAKRVKPPYIPTVNGRADTSNFDEEFTREIPILTPINAMLTEQDQQPFINFSYVANWAIDGNIAK